MRNGEITAASAYLWPGRSTLLTYANAVGKSLLPFCLWAPPNPGVQLAVLFAPASPAHRAYPPCPPPATFSAPTLNFLIALACPAQRMGLGKDEGCAPQETDPLVQWEWVESAFCAIWPLWLALLSGQGNSSHDLLRTAFTTYRTHFHCSAVSNITPARLIPTLWFLWWTRHDILDTARPSWWMCIISGALHSMYMHRLANDPEKAAGRTCENCAELQQQVIPFSVMLATKKLCTTITVRARHEEGRKA